MAKLTAKQIINILENTFKDYGEDRFGFFFDLEYFPDWFERDKEITYTENYSNFVKQIDLGPFEVIENYGGEGMGDSFWSVVRFTDHEVYLKFEGWYASYQGGYLPNSPVEVFPKEKIVTDWSEEQ